MKKENNAIKNEKYNIVSSIYECVYIFIRFHTVSPHPVPINKEYYLFIKHVAVGFQSGQKAIEWFYNLQHRSRTPLIIHSILLLSLGQRNTTRIYILLDVVWFDECVCVCSGFSQLDTAGTWTQWWTVTCSWGRLACCLPWRQLTLCLPGQWYRLAPYESAQVIIYCAIKKFSLDRVKGIEGEYFIFLRH